MTRSGSTTSSRQLERLRGKEMRTPNEVAAMLRLSELGWGTKRIASELGCSRNTVKRYVAVQSWSAYRWPRRAGKLAGLEAWLGSEVGDIGAMPTWCARILSASTGYQARRCIIPASGFYEWTGLKNARLTWYISAADGKPMSFAGLWEPFRDPGTGDDALSATIIVCAASEFMGTILDRMSVILAPADVNAWLAEPGGGFDAAVPRGPVAGVAGEPQRELEPVSWG